MNAIVPDETPRQPSALELAGEAANRAAARHVFADEMERLSANTRRAMADDLARFIEYLAEFDVQTGDLHDDPAAWRGVTWGIVKGFVKWMVENEYAVGTINRALSTIKTYAKLAFNAGIISEQDYALIQIVKGYGRKTAHNLDAARRGDGRRTRWERSKKAEHVSISDDDARALKRNHPDTPQGRRDALLMCLLLDHGLRCGEVAGLTVGAFDLKRGEMTFYRPKVNKVQTHRLTTDTRRALKAWVSGGDCPLASDAPVLRASQKDGTLGDPGMSERAITARVRQLGKWLGIEGLSAHDCRHAWTTRAIRSGTDLFALQEAGGWNSLAMPRRYAEAAKIANERVKLD